MRWIQFRYLVLWYCATRISYGYLNFPSRFQVEYEWSYLNYSWSSVQQYTTALNNGNYIPENNAPAGIKIYKDYIYFSIPRFRKGIPVTLANINMKTTTKKNNEILNPFPHWLMNDVSNCSNLQSVQSMEIDVNGIMWVLDGVRLINNINCPAKLMFLDLNNKGSLVYSYVFPNELSLQNGGFLNDIVIDDSDGGFAYITDNSNIDPGLIIYSRKNNRAWKIRDRTMFPEPWNSNFIVNNIPIGVLAPIDGIALSPKLNVDKNRTVFYTSLTGVSLFAISTTVLKDYQLCRTDYWRRQIQYVGEKQSQTDGMMMDNRGTLFYTLLPFNGVGSWNIFEHFSTSTVVDVNKDMIWPDGFAMDQKGYLYLISNTIFKFINPSVKLTLTSDIKFRIYKLYTGTKSYLYSN